MRDKLWFFGSYRTLTTAQRVEGIFGNAYAFDPSHWDYKQDQGLTVRDVQGRTMYQGRFTAQPTPKNRVTFSQENQYRCQGSTETFVDARLPHARRRLDGDGIDDAVAGGERSILRVPVLPDAGDLDGDRDEPAADRDRSQPALVRRRSGDRIAGRGLRPDPGRRAVGHRRSPRQLRVPRHQHRRRQLPEHQELALVGVVRDGRAQPEGRLSGGLPKPERGNAHGRVRPPLPHGQPRAEPVHLPASGLPECQSDDDGGSVRAGHLDVWPVDAARCRALRPGLELGPGRRQRDHRDRAVQRGADFVRADAQRGRVQRHLAARRCGVRRLRQRQDGDQVQLRPLPRAGHQ